MSITPISHRLLPAVFVVVLIAGCSGGEARKVRHMEEGQAFLTARNYEKARLEFRNALQIAPNDSKVRYENGVAAEKLGNHREAAQFYQGAIDADADNAPARAALGRLYVLNGDPNQALETIKPSIDRHPDDADLLTVRAAARDVLKDLPGALADAQRAVQLTPKNEDAVAVLAGVYQLNGQSDKSLSLLQEAVAQIPSSTSLRLALAEQYVRLEQEPQAEAVLADLVRLEPSNRIHRLRLAQFYARQNRADDAERVLRQGIAAIPKDRDLKTSLVDFLAAHRSREVAEKQLQTFIATDPNDNQLRFALARFYEQGKDLPKAEAVYRGVISTSGLDGPGLSARDRLAELRSQQNDVPGAEKLLAEVLDKNPRDDDALFLRATLSLRKQDPKTAIADLRSVLHDQPNAVGVMRVLARAHLANGEPALAEETMRRAVDASPKDPAVRLDLAKLLIDLDKPQQARPVVDELIALQPNSIEARTVQYQIASANKDIPAAKAAADAIVAINPKVALGYFYQGTVAEFDKRWDDAIGLYSTALDMQPTAPEGLLAITRVLVDQKRVPEALKRLDDWSARYPQSAVALNIKGEALATQQRHVEAMAAYQAAMVREPKIFAGYLNLAEEQLRQHDQNAAVTTLQQGIGQVTYPERLQLMLGVLYERTGKPDMAISVYEAALKQSPGSAAVANNLAMLLVDDKKDAASIERAKHLTEHFPSSNNPQLLDTYGWVLYKHGDAAAAVTALQDASIRAPGLSVLWYHLGMAQLQSGQSDAARESLTRSLKSGNTFVGIDQAKTTLDRLGRPAAVEGGKS